MTKLKQSLQIRTYIRERRSMELGKLENKTTDGDDRKPKPRSYNMDILRFCSKKGNHKRKYKDR